MTSGVLAGSGATGGPVSVSATGTVTAGTGANRRTNAGVGNGDIVGTLTSGAQTWASGAKSVFKVASATGAAGTGYDQLSMTTLSLSATGAYSLILTNAAGAALKSLADGAQFNLIHTTGGISVGGTNVANNANLTSLFVLDTSDIGILERGFSVVASGSAGGSQDLLISYSSAAAAPEPGSMLLAGLASAPVLMRRRARRRCA